MRLALAATAAAMVVAVTVGVTALLVAPGSGGAGVTPISPVEYTQKGFYQECAVHSFASYSTAFGWDTGVTDIPRLCRGLTGYRGK